MKLEKMTNSRYKLKQLNNNEGSFISLENGEVKLSVKNDLGEDKHEIFVISLSKEEIEKLYITSQGKTKWQWQYNKSGEG